ncbi:MAG TPA: hypothetical protein VF208_05095 [Candidatus Binatia bacterium]
MNAWEAIFAQSPVNDGYYDEKDLPHLRWDWPSATWLQARRNFLRDKNQRRPAKTPLSE